MRFGRRASRDLPPQKETVEAVKGVDIEVARGELVAFLGPNGAGKSTTMRMLDLGAQTHIGYGGGRRM